MFALKFLWTDSSSGVIFINFHDGLHLQELGKSSANAQGLRRPVTSGSAQPIFPKGIGSLDAEKSSFVNHGCTHFFFRGT